MSLLGTVRHHLTKRRLRQRWLVLLGTTALTLVPLVGRLGYENALLTAPLFSALGVIIGVDAIRDARAGGLTEGRRLSPVAMAAARRLLILLIFAAAALTLGQLWQRNCDPVTGAAFFVMGPVISGGLGVVCGLWGGVLATRRRWQLLLAAAVPLGSLGIAGWRLWADPVVFAYDPFWGHFSGAIYDTDVAIRGPYIVFRLYNLALATAAMMLWGTVVDPSSLGLRIPAVTRVVAARLLVSATLVAAASFVGLRAAKFRFTANVESITDVLSGTVRTEHFVIHYTPRSPAARHIDAVAAEHEFAWHHLATIMGREPPSPVHSFVFTGPDQKKALLGAGRVEVAAPWRSHIYLNHQPFPHRVLPHELAHVFGSTVGDSLLGVSRSGLKVNLALIEGLATALAPRNADRLDLHDQATVLDRLGKRPPLAAIMGPAFWTKSSRHAYTAAGSFCLWLIETHGFEPMAELYRSAGDFEDAYGTPLAQLEAKWLAFLAARDSVRDEDVEAQAQRFRRRSVFRRPCAHRATALLGKIGRATAKAKWTKAVEHYETLCAIEPEMPQHRLGLAHGLALAGRFDDAQAALDEAAAFDDLTVTIEAAVDERRGDVALAAGDLAAASTAYAAALSLPLSEVKRRAVLLKKVAADDPSLAPLIADYFAPFDGLDDGATRAVARLYNATAIRTLPAHAALGDYLIGRQLAAADRPAASAQALARSLGGADGDGATLPSADFVRAARLGLVSAYAQIGRIDEAEALLVKLKADPAIGSGHRLVFEQWTRRLAFYREYRAARSGSAAGS